MKLTRTLSVTDSFTIKQYIDDTEACRLHKCEKDHPTNESYFEWHGPDREELDQDDYFYNKVVSDIIEVSELPPIIKLVSQEESNNTE